MGLIYIRLRRTSTHITTVLCYAITFEFLVWVDLNICRRYNRDTRVPRVVFLRRRQVTSKVTLNTKRIRIFLHPNSFFIENRR